ncbi:MAG: hypothetical protein VZR54_07760 [Ruminococcus sp.]|jgi:uncharacterized protein (DUF305 family)|nr:hypothetical protein [Ruminococcus sp.]
MVNDEEMLQFIMKNAEMGCRGINDIKHYANSADMSNALRSQNLEYGHIYHNAYAMIRNRGFSGAHINPIVSAMARSKARREMKSDSSDNHIAEMMIKGNTMGVQKIAEHIRQYDGNNRSITNLADKLMSAQQSGIEEMKGFL